MKARKKYVLVMKIYGEILEIDIVQNIYSLYGKVYQCPHQISIVKTEQLLVCNIYSNDFIEFDKGKKWVVMEINFESGV
jgi:hypothetical protein